MGDVIYLGVTVAFFALTAWLAAFAERIMPRAAAREGVEGPGEER